MFMLVYTLLDYDVGQLYLTGFLKYFPKNMALSDQNCQNLFPALKNLFAASHIPTDSGSSLMLYRFGYALILHYHLE